jgi:DNA polymerase-3 subunit delta'
MSKISDDMIPLWGGLEGAPHPSAQTELIGHETSEMALLDAYRMGRLHHAWILGGSEGAGKATLAYRMARFLMVNPEPSSPQVRDAMSLAVDCNHPAARQTLRLAHPDIMVLQRVWNKDRKVFYNDIRVEDVRRAVSFFSTTAGAGGWRVCIVDTADDLNMAGANALLKVLEEPPPRCLFLILSTAPRRLLPTIRSRCRTLLLEPLTPAHILRILHNLANVTSGSDEAQITLAASAAEGSVRRAVQMLENNGLDVRGTLLGILDSMPHLDARSAYSLAEAVAGRDGEQAFEQVIAQVQDWIHTQTVQEAQEKHGELARWTALWEKNRMAVREAQIFNLDRRPLILSLLSDLAHNSGA